MQHVEFPLQTFERHEATQLPEFFAVAAEQRELQLSGHPKRGVGAHVGVAVSVASRPKPNAQHPIVESFTIRPTQSVGDARTQCGAGLEEHVLEVPNLANRLLVWRGRLALEERREAQLVQALSDLHQVVVLHGQGQVRDDRQHVAGVELGRVRSEHDAYGVLGQHGAHLVFEPVTTHPLHEAAKRFGATHVVELCVACILKGVDEYDLALDVLNDAKQERRAFLGIGFALPFQKVFQNLMRRRTSLQAHFTGLLQQGYAQSRLADAVQRQGQENPVENLVRVADHRLIILLLAHVGCKVTSYF